MDHELSVTIVRDLSDRLSNLGSDLLELVRAAPSEVRPAAALDALDVLAVAMTLKPAAMLGSGYKRPDFRTVFERAALLLEIVEGPQWASSLVALPSWYAAVVEEHRLRHNLLLVSGLTELPTALDAAGEAALLGYPLCCVRAFHRRQRLFHLLNIRAIRRQAGGDEAQMARLAGAQIVLTPRGAREQRMLAIATRAVFAPLTSIAMCRGCEENPDGPARQISRRYVEIVERLGLQELARISAL